MDTKNHMQHLKEAKNKLSQVCCMAGPKAFSLSKYHTPWFQKWKKWFLEKTRFNEHELIDQPIAFFFMVMVDDPDVLRTIEIMRKELPSQYRNSIFNDNRSFL